MTVAEIPTPLPGSPARRPGLSMPLLGRVAGAAWFLLLAAVYGRGLIEVLRVTPAGGFGLALYAAILSRGCTLIFFVTLAWLMLTRPPAGARRPGPWPLAVSLAGTYGVWAVALMPAAHLSPALDLVSAVVTLLGSVLIILAIAHLGRSFSIAPQARVLVTSGPYRLVRHPLYAAEEIALIGVAMHVAWWAAAPFLLIHLALQLRRMAYEEGLLRSVFPEYAAYADRTARLIPGAW